MIKALLSYLFYRGQEKVLDAVVRSSFFNLLARGMGYLRSVAIAVFLGFNIQTDAFYMALSLIGIFMIFADVFDSIGVPNLVRARLESMENFKRLSGLLFSFTLILTVFVLFLSVAFMPLVMKVPAGFSEKAIEYTKDAYTLLLPYLTFSFLFQHFGAVLRSLRRFTEYFLGEFLMSFVTFLTAVLGLSLLGSWKVLPITLSVGQAVGTFYILYVSREFIHLSFYVDDKVKSILKHFFYLSSLYGVLHLYILADRFFASFLGEKSVSALAYGLLLAGAVKGVLKFENIAITSLAEVEGHIKKLNFYLVRLLMLTVPLSVVFFVFSELIVKLFFGYGAFSRLDIELTSTATRFYALSIPFMFLWPVLYRVFQIKERLGSVAIVAIAGVIANVIFNYLFVFILKLGIAGICLGTFLAYTIICSSSYLILRRAYK